MGHFVDLDMVFRLCYIKPNEREGRGYVNSVKQTDTSIIAQFLLSFGGNYNIVLYFD